MTVVFALVAGCDGAGGGVAAGTGALVLVLNAGAGAGAGAGASAGMGCTSSSSTRSDGDGESLLLEDGAGGTTKPIEGTQLTQTTKSLVRQYLPPPSVANFMGSIIMVMSVRLCVACARNISSMY